MNDSHVVRLHYVVKAPEGITYENPPPVKVHWEEFELEVRDDWAVATMLVHCATEPAARLHVDEFLRAWQIDSALRGAGSPQLHFVFDRAEVIDRETSVGHQHELPTAGRISFAQLEVPDVTRHTYPDLPRITLSPEVETLWFRYSLYKGGRESLIGAAYFCYINVKVPRGGDYKAAVTLNISKKVLKKLRYLLNRVGDAATGRKMVSRPHTHRELQWIDAAVRALIRRVGEDAAGVTPLSDLTMADLPPLKTPGFAANPRQR